VKPVSSILLLLFVGSAIPTFVCLGINSGSHWWCPMCRVLKGVCFLLRRGNTGERIPGPYPKNSVGRW
jgi:hypothetical protein